MKRTYLLLVISLATLLLSSCRRAATPVATPTQDSMSGVYTAVAATLTAQALIPPTLTSTPLASPTSTPSPSPSPTSTTNPTVSITQGPAISPTSANLCDNSAYVSDVTIPDGTVVAPGQAFIKTWMLKNAGTCTWSKKYSLNFANGERMGGSDLNIGQSIAPGEEVKISISLVAPQTEKTYTGYWRLANENGNGFGATVWVQIVVSKSAGTLTPTITVTPTTPAGSSTPTSTTAPAVTKTPTSTTAPTSTETPPPTGTSSP